MEQNANKAWEVSEAAASQMRKLDDSLPRVLELIISRKGSFRTDEKWVHLAVEPLVKDGTLIREGSFLSIGKDFEDRLLSLAKNDNRYSESLLSYRKLMQDRQNEYALTDFEVYDKIKEIKGTDERILYLCSALSDAIGKLDAALEKTSKLESQLQEMDFTLSLLESMSDENPDS
tara:strand:+ start:125 stop:649 length:525 start_codon:yes stop_codon:yes gene_type:complete